jgi:hypothetical protein
MIRARETDDRARHGCSSPPTSTFMWACCRGDAEPIDSSMLGMTTVLWFATLSGRGSRFIEL